MPSNSTILKNLLEIQSELKVEKGQWNEFSKFYYRSKEDILEALKPLCHARCCVITCDDEVMRLDSGWVYILAKATLTDCETGSSITATGLAREAETKKGMDSSQITGTASSYAGKRALGNLFAIDDTKDSDSSADAVAPQDSPFIAKCRSCGQRFQFETGTTISQCNQNPCCPSPNYEIEH